MAAWSGEDFSPRSGGVVWHIPVRPKVGTGSARGLNPGLVAGEWLHFIKALRLIKYRFYNYLLFRIYEIYRGDGMMRQDKRYRKPCSLKLILN